VIRLLWGLTVLSAAAIIGAAVAADLLVHAPSSLILRALRHWSDVRYARKWGIPVEAVTEDAQARVAAELRADAVRTFGLTEQQWREFADAHQATAGGAS
jgi:hypothetical protein